MSSRETSERFVSIELRAAERGAAERAVAEAYAAGAVGCEERVAAEACIFVLYAPASRAGAVCAAARVPGVSLGEPMPLPQVAWSERWKQEAKVVEVSPRLAIRPSFDRRATPDGQVVLEIDPAQAFGTGAHESTRLALECIDRFALELGSLQRLLDVGTGTGVLALAALGLGCGRAVGLDVDPLAAQEARRNARRNGFAERLDVCVGEPAALAPDCGFAWVVANLLLAEVQPLLPAIAARVLPGGHAILSGLLEEQLHRVEEPALRLGLERRALLRRVDASGVAWSALVMRRGSAPASLRSPDRG